MTLSYALIKDYKYINSTLITLIPSSSPAPFLIPTSFCLGYLSIIVIRHYDQSKS